MTFNTGTATSYITLLDQLIQQATSNHLDTIAINAAGTGYTAGDILGITNTGSTNTHVAQIEVVTVGGGGAITAARIYRGGAYTVNPTTLTGNAATGGTGTAATFNLTFAATGWTLNRRTKVASSATVGSGGTGYSVSDVLTVVGGVQGHGGSPATFTVATLSGSAVATVTLLSAGKYEVPPANPAITSVSPAGGTGATLNVTYTDATGDTVVVLTGEAGGSNTDPVVAIKTYQGLDETGGNATFNWAAFMATAYSSVVPVHQLANISPGFDVAGDGSITTSASGDGAFVPLKPSDAFNINFWTQITGRHITLVAKVQGASTTYYSQLSFGLLNPFGITTEMPYPAYVLAASDRPKVWYKDTASLFGGLADVISRNNGPGFFWAPEGAWIQFRAALIATNTTLTPAYTGTGNSPPRALIWPLGYGLQHQTPDDQLWVQAPATGFDNSFFTAGSPTRIYRTPNAAGDLFPLFPLTVVQYDTGGTNFQRVLGQIDACFWFSVAGETISSEDRFTQSGERYTIFQSGTRIEIYSFFCIREV